MRLGKCIVAIRRLLLDKPEHVLIVAPNSALGGWEDELALEGETDVGYLSGTTIERRAALQEHHRWCLFDKEGWRWLPEVANERWDAVILDESTFIKNPKAKVTKFYLRNFRRVPHRWILTGLPNPEGLEEFWCQLAFLDGRAFGFGNYWDWRAKNFEPVPWGNGWDANPGLQSRVRREVGKRAFILHRRDVGLETDWVYEPRYLNLPRALRKTYNTVEDEFVLDVDGDAEPSKTIYAGARYAWMRQLCRGFADGEQIWKGAEDALVELLTSELARDPVVIWFDYNQELLAARKRFREAKIDCQYALGRTPQHERRQIFRDFRKGGGRVLLLQTRIAQYGLDLSRADAEIYFSAPASHELRAQSQERIVDVSKPRQLLCIDFVTRNTVDEDLHTSMQNKKVRSQRDLRRAMRFAMKRRRAP